MVLPASCWSALVTSSLVSRTAAEGSRGTFQAPMDARTSRRAAAVAGCPAVSVMRSLRGAAGWVSAIVSIWVSLPRWWSRSGLPRLTVAASPSEPRSSCLAPGLLVATQILMQLAVRDIGQLTDLLRVGMTSKSATEYDAVLRGVLGQAARVGDDRAATLASAKCMVDRLGELLGMGGKARVIAGEADRRGAKALGQSQGGQVRHLAAGGLPGAHGDPQRGRAQRGNIGGVADDGRQQVGEEGFGVGLHAGHPLDHLGGHL